MMKSLFLFFILVAVALADLSAVEGGNNVLVIMAENEDQSKYSLYFDRLRSYGFSLTIALSTKKMNLMKYGKAAYNHVIVMSPEASSLCQNTLEDFKAFIDVGGNVMLALNNNISKIVRDLAGNCGIDVDEEGSSVYDHSSYASLSKNADHKIISTSQILRLAPIFGSKKDSLQSIYFQGVGLVMNPNIYTLNTLVGEPSTFSLSKDGSILSTGKNTLLVASVQARNNARVTILGSLEMFSDEYAYLHSSSNTEFLEALTLWTFMQRGVLKYENIHHSKLDGTPADVMLKPKERPNLPVSNYPEPEVAPNNLVYRIKDDVVYSIDILEYTDGHWHGYNATDIQLEFRMLDPYVRITLAPESEGHYKGEFRIPDVYGIYKFRLFYRRPGYTVLESNTQVSIRPFRHNEFPRFIQAAYPYYTTVFTALIGFILFVALFLFI